MAKKHQIIVKITDLTSEESTIIITENLVTLARNYVTSYKAEHLNHIANQIEIKVLGTVSEKGITIENDKGQRLDELLKKYNEYVTENHANMKD